MLIYSAMPSYKVMQYIIKKGELSNKLRDSSGKMQ